jgi:hypothetical protein
MNFLLINYDFPPNPGIGGRRWAKLAKALASIGNKVYVVKAEFPQGSGQSPWAHDVVHENIQVYSANRSYPRAVSHPAATIAGRILYRFHTYVLSLKEKGTIYDQSIGWNHTMMPLCRKILLENNIDAIIATGAPWNLLVFAAQLKEEFPSCKLLVDYRDPWLNARNYGMANLSAKRKQAEAAKQQFVFERTDAVSTPYAYLTQQLQIWSEGHCAHSPQFTTIEHFFDPEDYPPASESKLSKNVFRMVYAGDIYLGSAPQWEMLASIIKNYEASQQGSLLIELYTGAVVPEVIQSLPCVKVHPPVGKSIFSIMQSADALIVVLPENKKDERTTKFFEYLPLRKPLLVAAPPGEVTHFVEKNNLGVHTAQSEKVIDNFLSGHFTRSAFNQRFDVSSHTSLHRAGEIMNLLS